MRWLAAILLLVATVVLAALLFERPSPAAAPADRAPRAALVPAVPDPTSVAGALRESAELREAAPVEAPPPPPEPDGVEEGGVVALPNVDFSWKYVRMTDEQLEQALSALDTEVQSESDKEVAQRFLDGRYVERRVPAGDARKLEEIADSVAGSGELRQARIVLDASEVGSTPSAARGRTVQVVALPRNELPVLYALVDERDWLRRFLATADEAR